ncbi:hypothetical protein OH76DRAFT_511622 [Lentinus brumalis]|uniref:Uncharacterized protein n=1 Tax=Lentinus brumalis TaxID=2498619 RepID=A0A371DB52_9APHY|nr:hypothetical protein OH76DRAFT_511622 [Polyporus brumalis]
MPHREPGNSRRKSGWAGGSRIRNRLSGVRCVKHSVRLSFTSVFLSATSLFVWSGGTEMMSSTACEVPGRHRGNRRKDLRGGRRGQRSRSTSDRADVRVSQRALCGERCCCGVWIYYP